MKNEKALLLDEIHHRVKNNFQIIISLIELQVVRHPENKNVFIDLINRIRSISLIYENLLLANDLTSIKFCEYTRFLIENIKEYCPSVNIELSYSKELPIRLEQATPIGVAINELITNACKHAFQGCDEKNILISIEEENNIVKISIDDDGIGIDEEFLKEDSSTLGFGLVKMLINDQLEGTLDIKRDDGTKVRIEFEKK